MTVRGTFTGDPPGAAPKHEAVPAAAPCARAAVPAEAREPVAAGPVSLAPLPLRTTLPAAALRPPALTTPPTLARAARPMLQRKATLSSPGDPYEREADAVADRVMRMAEPAPLRSAPVEIQRKCAACEEEDEQQRAIQTKRASSAGGEAAPDTGAAIRAARRGGEPLPRDVRAFFEPRFGYDFSQVRVRSDAEAAQAVQARAYTVGTDIVFGRGEYAPRTSDGQRLLAHELAHVIQQSPGPDAPVQAIQRTISFDKCTADQQAAIKKAHARALQMIDQTIEKLNKYDGTNPPEVKKSLDFNMKDSSVALARGLAKRLARLKPDGDSTTYECNMKGKSRGWSAWCVPFTDIELHPAWFADTDVDAQARTMIHEWLHRYQCAFDLAYQPDEKYAKLSPGQSKQNADSIARFVFDAR